jgi:hypothetical protein
MLHYSDGNIRYFEYESDDLFLLSEYKSTEPQRGIAFMPKYALNAHDCEVARAFKVTSNLIEPISFIVPRRVSIITNNNNIITLLITFIYLFSLIHSKLISFHPLLVNNQLNQPMIISMVRTSILF